jgi:uncharacterized protein (DUF3084 family)
MQIKLTRPKISKDVQAHKTLLEKNLSYKIDAIQQEYNKAAKASAKAYQEYSGLPKNHMHKERYKRIWENYAAERKHLESVLNYQRTALQGVSKLVKERQKIYDAQNQIRITLPHIRSHRDTVEFSTEAEAQDKAKKLNALRQLKKQRVDTITEAVLGIKKVKRKFFDVDEVQKA